MTTRVEAIYEQGILRLKEPLFLQDGAEVEVIVIAGRKPLAENLSPAELLARISQLPVEGADEEFSARNHDQVLYGGKDKR